MIRRQFIKNISACALGGLAYGNFFTNKKRWKDVIVGQGFLQEVWGTEFPGAHGLTLNVENGEDMLYIADNNRHEVIKTTIDGKVVQVFPYPKESRMEMSI